MNIKEKNPQALSQSEIMPATFLVGMIKLLLDSRKMEQPLFDKIRRKKINLDDEKFLATVSAAIKMSKLSVERAGEILSQVDIVEMNQLASILLNQINTLTENSTETVSTEEKSE